MQLIHRREPTFYKWMLITGAPGLQAWPIQVGNPCHTDSVSLSLDSRGQANLYSVMSSWKGSTSVLTRKLTEIILHWSPNSETWGLRPQLVFHWCLWSRWRRRRRRRHGRNGTGGRRGSRRSRGGRRRWSLLVLVKNGWKLWKPCRNIFKMRVSPCFTCFVDLMI